MTLVAGVDSSTQSCKVVIRDLDTGAVVRTGRATHPAGTEVDPEAWWAALLAAIADAGGLDDVSAISIAGQQHGMVVLDAAGRVIRPALLWNDTRSAQAATDLIDEVGAEAFAQRTGTVPVASFTITKLRWLRDHEPENAARVAAVALPHDWLTWRLRGYGPAAQPARARPRRAGHRPLGCQRHLLLEPRHRRLRPGPPRPALHATPAPETQELLHFRVLPTVTGSGGQRRTGLAFLNLRRRDGWRIVVGAGMGDNAGAALGLGARTGDVVVSIGTSGTVFAVTDRPVPTPPARWPDSRMPRAVSCRSSRPSTPRGSSMRSPRCSAWTTPNSAAWRSAPSRVAAASRWCRTSRANARRTCRTRPRRSAA